MTAKELATMFSGCRIPVPEMEKMIKKHVQDELEKFSEMAFPDADIELKNQCIQSYLNQTK